MALVPSAPIFVLIKASKKDLHGKRTDCLEPLPPSVNMNEEMTIVLPEIRTQQNKIKDEKNQTDLYYDEIISIVYWMHTDYIRHHLR